MLRLGRILVAGTAYAVTVLMVGTVLGVVRVLMLEPRFGALEATMLELPLLLGLAWLISAWLTGHCGVAARLTDRVVMSGLALLLLLGAEFALAIMLGRTPDYREPASLLGLAGQVAFASLPLVQLCLFERRARAQP